MKKISLLFLILISSAVFVIAQEGKDKDAPPPGMEYIQVTQGYRRLVPKGIKMVQNGATLVPVEPFEQYASRRFQEMDDRLRKIEETERELRGELEQLRLDLSKIQEKIK